MEGFAYDDLRLLHDRRYRDEREVRLFGKRYFRDGIVAPAMRQAAIENGSRRSNIYFLQDSAAWALARTFESGLNQPPRRPITILPGSLEVEDGDQMPLSRATTSVLAIGACMEDWSITADQAAFIDEGHEPFRFTPLTPSHFMNMMLDIAYWNAVSRQARTLPTMDLRQYFGRETGIDAPTAEMAANPTRDNTFDVVLAISNRHVNPVDLEKAISRSYQLLRPAGALVIRDVVSPSRHETGIAVRKQWAVNAGFNEHFSKTIRGGIGLALNSRGKIHTTKFETVVFTKA